MSGQKSNPTIVDTNALAVVQSIAVWPQQAQQLGIVSDVALTQGLLNSNALKVVTPMMVLQTLQSNALSQAVEEMTDKERMQVFKVVADKTEADAVLFLSSSSMKSDLAVFSLSRASTTESFTLILYSREKDDVIWQDTMNVKMSGGGGKTDFGNHGQSFAPCFKSGTGK
ncbi:MAG TPA: hypothetical protein VHG89_02935 [Verrucomicrobiae bacterium]|nr:hypothetical protein [Verrucomicrobiae bacterium]